MDILGKIIGDLADKVKKEVVKHIKTTPKQKKLFKVWKDLDSQHDEICKKRSMARKKFWQTVEVENDLIGKDLGVKKDGSEIQVYKD